MVDVEVEDRKQYASQSNVCSIEDAIAQLSDPRKCRCAYSCECNGANNPEHDVPVLDAFCQNMCLDEEVQVEACM